MDNGAEVYLFCADSARLVGKLTHAPLAGARSPRLGLVVRHTDAEREFAYDRQASFGRLDRALGEAAKRGWVVADMRRDWKRVFAEPAGIDEP